MSMAVLQLQASNKPTSKQHNNRHEIVTSRIKDAIVRAVWIE